ncbi:ABC transporter ATP-binding protein [uncultured Pseudoramibacter sp.]|uniref:ABC transporter ATP-binding protein n=1 Tax=uncultured Pseudoramibacter sp. TaxID=1623493 RepID=UPI0025E2DBA5|nr:ABC transporter ATP-binding protein [uncultured Pseudoramibacter sp.]
MNNNQPQPRRRGPHGPGPQLGVPTEKIDLRASWGRILGFNKKFIPMIIVAVIAAAFGSVLMILGPDRLKEITNLIAEGFMTGIDMDRIWDIVRLLIAMYAGSFALSFLQHWLLATVNQRISQSLRSAIQTKIHQLPMAYFNQVSTGDVLSRMTNDIDTIGQSFNQAIGMLFTSVAMFVGALVMMLKTNLTMTAAAAIASLIGFLLMQFIMTHSQHYFTDQQSDLGAINGHVEEIFTNHTTVKVYNEAANEAAAFDKMNEHLRQSAFRAQGMSGLMMPLMQFIGNFGYVAVCVTGAWLAIDGQIKVGVIVAFMLYVRYFTQPLSQIAQAFQSLQLAGAAGNRVFDFLSADNMPDESDKQKSLPEIKGTVTFDHVKFGYNPDKIIIHDFSATARPGQKIAIVGPTGAGKTTLINLLMRFYEVDGGRITIDGIDTRDMTREQVHDQFCMVLQETWLFEGTLRENLTFGTDGITDRQLDQACRAVGLDHFIATLPDGYDTMLDDKTELSQGQRQQLTIARAMLENKPMLILDEATSSVDTRTEQQIQRAMDELMTGRTSFVIAHRLSTIRDADLILVLRDGDVVESGTHEELLAQNGFYADLYMSQFDTAA